MKELRKKYEISKADEILCAIIRKVRGTNNPPKWLYSYSVKKYGAKDNLIRYYLDRYVGLAIGKYTYGIKFASSRFIKSIGAFCSIASDLHIAPNGHRLDYFTTWNTLVEHNFEKPIEHSIVIGNDVWIGTNVTILSGVTVGDGAVLAAGSIITKDVEPYAVIGGVNRCLKYRFNSEICDELQRLQWWAWEDKKIFESFEFVDKPNEFIKIYSNNDHMV